MPTERIYRYGDKDNWWGPAGKEGPCGPCSELHYDRGIEHGCGSPDCHPNHECERFVELWNLVFMQFYQDTGGNRTPLPAPSIDTGLGLERAAAILQDKGNLYETDIFWPIVQQVCKLTKKEYGVDRDTDYALRVVAEHGRAAAFLIADGVVPGNEGRGYVLRRIIRRAVFYGRKLTPAGVPLNEVADAVVERMQSVYPELLDNWSHIRTVLLDEDLRFVKTLENGSRLIRYHLVRMSGNLEKNFGDPTYWALAHQERIEALAGWASDLPEHIRDAFVEPLKAYISSLPAPSQVTDDHHRRIMRMIKEVPGKVAFILWTPTASRPNSPPR